VVRRVAEADGSAHPLIASAELAVAAGKVEALPRHPYTGLAGSGLAGTALDIDFPRFRMTTEVGVAGLAVRPKS
jgi:hypothetical protein